VRLVTKCDNRSQSSLGKSDFREERETLSHFVTGSEGDHGQAPASGIVPPDLAARVAELMADGLTEAQAVEVAGYEAGE